MPMDKPTARIDGDKPSLTIRPTRPVTPKERKPAECEHRYRVLDKETTTAYANSMTVIRKIEATFFCEKCLAVEHKTFESGE
jgi:hypothetical protein